MAFIVSEAVHYSLLGFSNKQDFSISKIQWQTREITIGLEEVIQNTMYNWDLRCITTKSCRNPWEM